MSPSLSLGVASWGVMALAASGMAMGKIPVGPVLVAHWALTGLGGASYRDILYGHIHLFPPAIALGNLLDNQVRTIEVWNARDDAQLLSSIATITPDGTVISGASLPPATFGPLESKLYNVSISAAGAAVLNAVFTWQFPAEQPQLVVTGTRVIAMTFCPDWSEPPEELLTWKTEVLRAYKGTEQRVQILGQPRRKLSFSYLLEDASQNARFQSQVWGWQGRVFAVPVWMDQQWLAADLAAGAVAVPYQTAYQDIEAGQSVLLWADVLTWEIVETASFDATSIQLKQPTRLDWAKGTRVVPVRLARMPKALQWGRPNALMSQLRIDWSVDTSSGIAANRILPSGLPLYQGYEVLTEEPDWSFEVGESAELDEDLVDFEVGPVAYDPHTSAPEFSRPFNWVMKGRDAIARFLGFLDGHSGRQVPFWLPSYAHDMEQAQDAAAADVSIQIRDIEYSVYIAQHLNRRDLAFYPLSGPPIFRRITASSQGVGNVEWITLDQSFGQTRKASDWSCISFLTFVRLDQDSLQLVWETDDLLRVSFRVKEILL
ncbi:hypothetical protein [Geothrix sp. PMB-07]|uniref:hypothetical protein n=1 Tax=Geothrix sp. PMB-07 TaxID=3068640 RepID=UPI0027405DFE|nr:hypothetical protein [Geothrix sp. PMB-07]WLT32835.1 hypothetical protein Q9293_05755 [Geothrix sp. PMB-07]